LVTFNDTPCNRKREAQAAPLVIERPRARFVCVLYASVLRDDHDDRTTAADAFDATIGDDRARGALFAHNCPKNRRECVAEPDPVANRRCAGWGGAHVQAHIAISCLMHSIGHFPN